MAHPFRQQGMIDEAPSAHLRRIGHIFAVFGDKTQDSGNISYGVEIAGQRFFVKTAGSPDDRRWFLPHRARVALLRNAILLRRSCRHECLPELHQVVESPYGPMLVYECAAGEHLYGGAVAAGEAHSAFRRFVELPVENIAAVLDVIYDLHDELAEAGWVAEDFYDGCLIYDFASHRLRVVDLDTYHHGPFINERGRLFGSTRFMAPEEFVRGARIDQRTTVFTLGRAAAVFLGQGSVDRRDFRGGEGLFVVVARACTADPAGRFPTVRDFCAAWRDARQAG